MDHNKDVEAFHAETEAINASYPICGSNDETRYGGLRDHLDLFTLPEFWRNRQLVCVCGQAPDKTTLAELSELERLLDLIGG